MIKIKEFKDVDRILLSNRLIIQRPNSASYVNDDLSTQLIVEEYIYYSRVLNNMFLFQIENENNLNVKLVDVVKGEDGLWGLLTAFPIGEDSFYIFHQGVEQSPKFVILNKELEILRETVGGCNYGSNGYLFRCYGNRISCFDAWSEKSLWESEQRFAINQSVFIVGSEAIFFTLESGELIALNISTGEEKWKQERMGRVTVFDDKIYSIADYKIRELDADTGYVLKEANIQNLVGLYDFMPTGEHKVYDEYIFSMASGKPGLVAIFSRKTLQFKEMLKLDEMIPRGMDHLYWHNKKLYILDFAKELHVFEEE